MTFLMTQAIFEPTFSGINILTILKPSYSSCLPPYEDGTDRLFRNVGILNSDSGELHRRKNKNVPISFVEIHVPYFVSNCVYILL
jgi:hypothetical protein